jgi:hypothetical protein
MPNSLPGRRGRAPRTDPEWAREIQRRLVALEQATTLRIGPWVLSGTEDGHLTAHAAEGRHAVLTGITDISQIDTLTAKVNELEIGGQRNQNDLQQLIDAIVKGFTAWTGQSNFDTSAVQDFSNTVGQALGTLGTLGLRLQKLENGGALVLEDFASYPNATTLGANWLQWEEGTGQGTIGVTNKYAIYNLQLDNVQRTAHALHKTSAGTALHRVSATISTPQDVFGQSENFLIARANYATDTDYVFAAMTWTRIRLGYVKAGNVTEIKTRDWLFKNGSTYSLDCTIPNTVRLLENTNVLLEASDVGAPTGLYTGFAMKAPNGAARPGVIGSFAVFDDAPSTRET